MFVGSRLKELRKNNNMTQSELGSKLNVTKVSICCYEKNVRVPGIDTLEDLSNIFGVSTDYFLGKDIPVVMEDSEEYHTHISKDEYNLLKQLRLNKDLYYKIIDDPKRMVELIDKKLK